MWSGLSQPQGVLSLQEPSIGIQIYHQFNWDETWNPLFPLETIIMQMVDGIQLFWSHLNTNMKSQYARKRLKAEVHFNSFPEKRKIWRNKRFFPNIFISRSSSIIFRYHRTDRRWQLLNPTLSLPIFLAKLFIELFPQIDSMRPSISLQSINC